MIKTATIFLPVILCTSLLLAQGSKLDSLNRLISKASSDTQRINLQLKKAGVLSSNNLDSAIAVHIQLINESKKISYYKGEVDARLGLSGNYAFKGNCKAEQEQLTILEKIIRPSADSLDLASLYSSYGLLC
jgi:two-component system NtrC family sensor kinase